MRIHLIEDVCKAIAADATRVLKEYIQSREPEVDLSKIQGETGPWYYPNSIEPYSIELFSYVQEIEQSYGMDTVTIYLDPGYVLKLGKYEWANNKDDKFTQGYGSLQLKLIFRQLGYIPSNNDEDCTELVEFIFEYINKLPMPQWQINLQKKSIWESIKKQKIIINKTQEGPGWGVDEIETKSLKNIFKERLGGEIKKGTKWYLYFYGYDLVGKNSNTNNYFPLARLVLEFIRFRNQKELTIKITNNENKDHYNYSGYTDFDSSSKKVLVMNLRTADTEYAQRQLNMKIYIDGAKGSFYLGQYLNYEVDTGRIISGSLIIEQSTLSHPTPQVFRVPKSGDSDRSLESVKHILPFFKDLRESFRETKPILYSVVKDENNIPIKVIPITDL